MVKIDEMTLLKLRIKKLEREMEELKKKISRLEKEQKKNKYWRY